jgi:hypothetical protein
VSLTLCVKAYPVVVHSGESACTTLSAMGVNATTASFLIIVIYRSTAPINQFEYGCVYCSVDPIDCTAKLLGEDEPMY